MEKTRVDFGKFVMMIDYIDPVAFYLEMILAGKV